MASRVAGTVAQFHTPIDSVTVHGAAASIPMVTEALSARVRTMVVVAESPEHVVVKGAVLWGVGIAGADVPTVPNPVVHERVVKPSRARSMWTRGRVWTASGAAALVLVLGGFVAAQSVGGPASTGPAAPVPSAQMVGAVPPGR